MATPGMMPPQQPQQQQQADPEQDQLRQDLGVQPGQQIPPEHMQRALAGHHGPEVQKRAQNVHARQNPARADARKIFGGHRPAAKPAPAPQQQPAAPAGPRRSFLPPRKG